MVLVRREGECLTVAIFCVVMLFAQCASEEQPSSLVGVESDFVNAKSSLMQQLSRAHALTSRGVQQPIAESAWDGEEEDAILVQAQVIEEATGTDITQEEFLQDGILDAKEAAQTAAIDAVLAHAKAAQKKAAQLINGDDDPEIKRTKAKLQKEKSDLKVAADKSAATIKANQLQLTQQQKLLKLASEKGEKDIKKKLDAAEKKAAKTIADAVAESKKRKQDDLIQLHELKATAESQAAGKVANATAVANHMMYKVQSKELEGKKLTEAKEMKLSKTTALQAENLERKKAEVKLMSEKAKDRIKRAIALEAKAAQEKHEAEMIALKQQATFKANRDFLMKEKDAGLKALAKAEAIAEEQKKLAEKTVGKKEVNKLSLSSP